MNRKTTDPRAGERLRQIRQHRGISQARIAKAIDVGIGTIQHYERGRVAITTDRLQQLARALQCEPADLLQPPGSPLPRYRYSRQLMAHNNRRTWMIAPPPDEEQ